MKAKLELTNKQLESIVNKFDTDRIDFDKGLMQEFEVEEAFTNEFTRKEIDLNVTVNLIQTNNTIEVESVSFELIGFYLATPDNLELVYDEKHLDLLEENLKCELNR